MATRKICQEAIIGFLLCWLAMALCNDMDQTEMQTRHEDWMSKYNRVYKTMEEKAKRFAIFKTNVEKIAAHNKLDRGYLLEENLSTDLTDDEFNVWGLHETFLPPSTLVPTPSASLTPPQPRTSPAHAHAPAPAPRKPRHPPHQKPSAPPHKHPAPPPRKSHAPPPHKRSSLSPSPSPSPSSHPSAFDWRRFGAVTSVKNGSSCAADWAFAIVATIEAVRKVKTEKLKAFSAQQLVDCYNNNEWECGKPPSFLHLHHVFENVMKYGVNSQADYPYNGKNDNCKKISNTPTKIANYSYVPSNNETALEIAVTRQPLVVKLAVSISDVRFYKSGIYEGPCDGNEKHPGLVVALIGYGKEGKKKYWIAKHSWGSKWGEEGYIRIKKNVENESGQCGVAKLAYYPIA